MSWPLDHNAPRVALLQACACAHTAALPTSGRAVHTVHTVHTVLRDSRFTQQGGRDGQLRSCGSVYACFTTLFLRLAACEARVPVSPRCSSIIGATVARGVDGALLAVCRMDGCITRLLVEPAASLERENVARRPCRLADLRRHPRQAAVAADTGMVYIANFGDRTWFGDEDDDSNGYATQDADQEIHRNKTGNVLVATPRGRITSIWERERTSVQAPGGVCVTPEFVIVSCLLTGRLVLLDRATGEPRRHIGAAASSRNDRVPGKLRRPGAVCAFGCFVAVLDRALCHVSVFEMASNTWVKDLPVQALQFPRNPNTQVLFPCSIASSPNGQLAVLYRHRKYWAIRVYNNELETVFQCQGKWEDEYGQDETIVLRDRDVILCASDYVEWLCVSAT